MKILFTGIFFSNTLDDFSEIEKCKLIVKSLSAIAKQTQKLFGDEGICLALAEYGMATYSITVQAKKELLKLLHGAVKRYPNLILITGTIPCHSLNTKDDDTSDRQRKKIAANYSVAKFLPDQDIESEFERYQSVYRNETFYVLQNAAHVLTANSKTKHHKSATWEEYKRLCLNAEETKLTTNSIFYIGNDVPIITTRINNQQLKLGVLICREHHVNSNSYAQLRMAGLDIVVIVADSAGFYPHKFPPQTLVIKTDKGKTSPLQVAVQQNENFSHIVMQTVVIAPDLNKNLNAISENISVVRGEIFIDLSELENLISSLSANSLQLDKIDNNDNDSSLNSSFLFGKNEIKESELISGLFELQNNAP